MPTHKETLDKAKEYINASYDWDTISYIPKKTDLTFGNTVKLIDDVIVFYIDMRKSREILINSNDFWSIKIHKAFLKCVTDAIERRDGHIRSFNGDGILAFFIGDNYASKAVRAALDISGYVSEMNKTLENKGKSNIDFGIGIAHGKIKVAKSGKSGEDSTKQDLVWVGAVLYKAVELSECGKNPQHIFISKKIRNFIQTEQHLNVVNNSEGKSIWLIDHKDLKSEGPNIEVRTTNYYGIVT